MLKVVATVYHAYTPRTIAAYSPYMTLNCGFGGLEVACWPLLPKFAGPNPAEAVGFFTVK